MIVFAATGERIKVDALPTLTAKSLDLRQSGYLTAASKNRGVAVSPSPWWCKRLCGLTGHVTLCQRRCQSQTTGHQRCVAQYIRPERQIAVAGCIADNMSAAGLAKIRQRTLHELDAFVAAGRCRSAPRAVWFVAPANGPDWRLSSGSADGFPCQIGSVNPRRQTGALDRRYDH